MHVVSGIVFPLLRFDHRDFKLLIKNWNASWGRCLLQSSLEKMPNKIPTRISAVQFIGVMVNSNLYLMLFV